MRNNTNLTKNAKICILAVFLDFLYKFSVGPRYSEVNGKFERKRRAEAGVGCVSSTRKPKRSDSDVSR